MVMIKNSTPIAERRGRFGGGYYKKDQFGQHFQVKHYRKYTPSAAQLEQRKFFTQIRNFWISYPWSDIEIEGWRIWARWHPIKNKLGETRVLNPWQAFLRVNLARLRDSDPITTVPF